MDMLVKAIDPDTRVRYALADVTLSAKALEARHLSGPTAGMALAEGLTAVALLAQDLAAEDEAVLFRMVAAGPLKGLTVEATGGGALRGYTSVKALGDLDGAAAISTDAAWGEAASAQVVVSRPGAVLHRAALPVAPARVQFALARYFNHSEQTPTAAAIVARADAGGLIRAAGALAQRMPDSDREGFVQTLEAFEEGAVHARLARGAGFAGLREALHRPRLDARESRPLRFACRCTRARTLAALELLTLAELAELVDANRPQRIFCHMCGETFEAGPEEIRGILAHKQQTPARPGTPEHAN